jgi:type IV pilus assembly protein PilP
MTRAAYVTVLATLLGLCLACAEEKVIQSTGKPAAAAPKPGAAPPARRGPAAPAPAASSAPPPIEFNEVDFVETDKSRDPFRSFKELFTELPAERLRVKRKVILENYSVDDLRLIGLVTGIIPAKAMLVDPTGQGFVIEKNDFVGRAERVQVGVNNTEYEINWRVDKIRESDVVLVREDPSNPDIPSATRVIALRPKEKDPEEEGETN